MKQLSIYITEAGQKGRLTQAVSGRIYKNLLIDDRERIEDIDRHLTHRGTIPSFEDIEQFFWKGAGKDKVDDYYGYITSWLKDVNITPGDIVNVYSLARSGKQMKIEVIASVIHALISYYTYA